MNINLLSNDGGDVVEVVDELLEVIPHLALGKDEMQGLEVIPGLGLHHG